MKRLHSHLGLPPAAALLVLGLVPLALADDSGREAAMTVKQFEKTDPGLTRFFENSAGYVVFPSVGKGGFIVGGAHGDGILFEKGMAAGKATVTQLSVGAQAGGEAYSEVILFDSRQSLANFKGGNFEFSAAVSAVALKSGASANAQYKDGVAVVTASKGGMMLEASVGGQKFSYHPFQPT
jgi:lipid-binding SYLF domain-containing protein